MAASPTRTPTPTRTLASTDTPAPATATTAPTKTPVPPTPTDTPAPQLSGKILYPVFSEESGWYDVYIQPVDGAERQWLVGAASQPAISPDGQTLAFRSWQADDRGIRVLPLAGGERRRVTDRVEDGLPSWSPDGGMILFSSRRESDRVSRIYTVSPYGGEIHSVQRNYKSVYGTDPMWQPDGRIVYKAIQGFSGLFRMNPDGSGPLQLTSEPSDTTPMVSPDSQTVAFMSQRDGNWKIYRLAVDGSGLQRLTNHGAQDGLPAWSPDGQWIAFVSDRDGEWAVWAMSAQGDDVQRLFSLQGLPGGRVQGEPEFSSRGWTEEQIQWLP